MPIGLRIKKYKPGVVVGGGNVVGNVMGAPTKNK